MGCGHIAFLAWAQLHPLLQVHQELVGGTEPMRLLYETSAPDLTSCPHLQWASQDLALN